VESTCDVNKDRPYLTDPTAATANIRHAVVSSMSHNVSASPIGRRLHHACSPTARKHHINVPKDCNGVVPDCHGVTPNVSRSSSVMCPVCGGTLVSAKMVHGVTPTPPKPPILQELQFKLHGNSFALRIQVGTPICAVDFFFCSSSVSPSSNAGRSRVACFGFWLWFQPRHQERRVCFVGACVLASSSYSRRLDRLGEGWEKSQSKKIYLLPEGISGQEGNLVGGFDIAGHASDSSFTDRPYLTDPTAIGRRLHHACSPTARRNHINVPKDCNGGVPDCHGVTLNVSRSSSVMCPVCGGTVVSAKMVHGVTSTPPKPPNLQELQFKLHGNSFALRIQVGTPICAGDFFFWSSSVSPSSNAGSSRVACFGYGFGGDDRKQASEAPNRSTSSFTKLQHGMVFSVPADIRNTVYGLSPFILGRSDDDEGGGLRIEAAPVSGCLGVQGPVVPAGGEDLENVVSRFKFIHHIHPSLYPSLYPLTSFTYPPSSFTVAAPDLLDPKAAAHNSKPRLSFSAKPVVLNSPEDFEPRFSVMRWKTVLTVFLLVVLYLIVGATVFKALEQPHESSHKLAILSQKLQFLIDHPCVNQTELEDLVKWSQDAAYRTLPTGRCPQDTAHRTLPTGRCPQDTVVWTVLQVMLAIRAGVNPSGNSSNQTSLWDLSSSFFFAGTVITTIVTSPALVLVETPNESVCGGTVVSTEMNGFGNISPHTEGGRIFCIVYALLGIPLFGFLLAGVGDQLGTIFGKGIAKVEKMIVKWKVSQTKIRVISTVLFILFGCLLFVTLPAIIFKHIEGWSTLEAIYFVVITLTTIGFGDFVAGGSETEYLDYYKPVVWFWILVGLAYFAAVLSMIGDWFRVISKKTKEEVGEFRAHAAEWTANVSAEFKETRRRLSVDIYDKFQRAASIKRKLSAELGLNNPAVNQEMGKRTLSVNLGDEREAYQSYPLSRNGSLFMNGLSPEYAADRRDIAVIEHLK
ncbi:hypothetical protein NFI96_033493, partial [Prochilodus magdalenae]